MSLKVIRKNELPNELKQQKADEIQRHEFYQFGSDAFMMESTDGEYVKYEDHIALLSKSREDA